MTTAIVLSGGGIRGPLEVGALESLFEHGIRPDFFVGTSAGAINSAFTAAAGPELSSIAALKTAWRKGARDIVYPGNLFTILLRTLTFADSFFPSDGMRKLIETNLPPSARTFGDLKCPCYLTTVDLQSGRMFLFGEDPSAPLVDAIMASSSVPVYQPPVDYHGLQLVDGGVAAAMPAGVAMDKGATVIYAVNVGRGEESLPPVHGVFNIFFRTLDTLIAQNLFQDLKRADENAAIVLHHIHITAFADLPFNDFSHIDEMYQVGKQVADAYLANPQPRALGQPSAAVTRSAPPPPPPLQRVPGAREFRPLRLRG